MGPAAGRLGGHRHRTSTPGLGLAAHAAGYVLLTLVTTEPFRFLADLLYGLGLALWTGIVVVWFVQVFPQSTRRDLEQLIGAYEASKRREPGPGT